MLMRTVGTTVTKYVYGLGLISEETNNTVKVYHFDYRGSTVAITDVNGNISDTFEYDTYGLIVNRTGTSDIIFCYNGRDGVVTDKNGLFYMRARYYSPDMRRFVNADILHGKISDSTSLNRYSYVNGNPVSFVDPFGLSAERDIDSNNISPNYTQAVFVCNFNYQFPINVTGHTQLYFWDNKNKKWYITEFTGGNKSSAAVIFKEETPPVYDSSTTGKLATNSCFPSGSRRYNDGQSFPVRALCVI